MDSHTDTADRGHCRTVSANNGLHNLAEPTGEDIQSPLNFTDSGMLHARNISAAEFVPDRIDRCGQRPTAPCFQGSIKNNLSGPNWIVCSSLHQSP